MSYPNTNFWKGEWEPAVDANGIFQAPLIEKKLNVKWLYRVFDTKETDRSI